MQNVNDIKKSEDITLVLGGNGKTGRRVVERLKALDVNIRIGSRNGTPPFEWDDRATWPAALNRVTSVYVVYYPDLAVPGATDAIRAFTDLAVLTGVQRIVLLSGRGEEEAQRCERIVQGADVAWTIVRASWFCQNFSEGAFREMVLGGKIALPAEDIGEPFIDVEDIAEVVTAALTEDRHAGQVYEVTGPRLLTFAQAADEITKASGRQVAFHRISNETFNSAMAAQGVPEDAVALLNYLLATVLDGRNAHINNGVQRALGRPPRDFTTYAKEAAAAGAWQVQGGAHG